MPLHIYDVIFWEGDGEPDTIYIVTAQTHLDAVEMAEDDRRTLFFSGRKLGLSCQASTVSLVGESRLTLQEPQILRGPFREIGYTRGQTWLYDEQTRKWLPEDEYFKPKAGS